MLESIFKKISFIKVWDVDILDVSKNEIKGNISQG